VHAVSDFPASDRTNGGTTRVTKLSFPCFNPTQAIANINGSLFFLADDGFHGFELRMIPAGQLEGGDRHHGGDDHGGGTTRTATTKDMVQRRQP
jgi:hypothetical protein